MSILQCPQCDTRLKLPPSYTGKKARCPKCRGLVDVPSDEVEEDVAVVEEEDSSPSRRVTPRRKPRLSEDEPVPSSARRRQAVREEEDDDEPDDEPAPRKKRPRRRKREQQGPTAATVIGIALFVFAFWLLLAGLGYRFRPVSYAMIVVGAVLSWIGTKWILSIAAEEGTGTYLACMFVPFYDTWFTFTRIGQTWVPCLIGWAGRFFAVAGIVLLIIHFLHGDGIDHDGDGPRRGRGLGALLAGGIDGGAEHLLKSTKCAEAKAWLGEPNKRRGILDLGKPAAVQLVNDLYARGAVQVMAADIEND